MKAKVEIHLFIGGLVDWKFLYVQVSMPEDNTSVQVIACNTSTWSIKQQSTDFNKTMANCTQIICQTKERKDFRVPLSPLC